MTDSSTLALVPEEKLDLSVVEEVNSNLDSDADEANHKWEEQQQYNGVDEGVLDCQEHPHQTHGKDHCTQLHIAPVDHKVDCVWSVHSWCVHVYIPVYVWVDCGR